MMIRNYTQTWRFILPFVWLLGLLLAAPVQAKLKIGSTAPDFTLPDHKGVKYSLADLRKKGHVMLIFWAVECVYCYAHIKDYKAIHKKYDGKGLTLVGINIAGEYPEDVAEYVKDNAIPYITLADRLNNLDVAEAYKAIVTPTYAVISPAGKIVYHGYEIPNLEKLIK